MNTKNIVLAIIGIIIVVIIGVVSIGNSQNTNNTNVSNPSDAINEIEESNVSNNNSSEEESNIQTYTLADVSAGNSVNNCLVIFSNEVYLIPSSFINNSHQGGSKAILDYCGKDLTEAFQNNPFHNSSAKTQLNQFKAGVLSN